jgi:hypothetical protein
MHFEPDIFRCSFVPLFAMGLQDAAGRRATPNVFSLGHCFQMLWIYAETIAAQMVYLQPYRYLTIC